tara:strand:- start:1109 stop:2683 length:1575 start_codon:yes stop_codon:yes gene_type:complete
MPRKPLPENMLPLASPKLVKEWHSTKNGSLVPDQISLGSTKKIWWKCPNGDDHEWEASPNSRGKGSGCPICSGRKVMKSNCLATTHPQIAKEWHPSKNEDKRPEQFTAGTLTKIWWQCPKGEDHEWQAQINNRKNGNDCPFCAGNKASITNSLKTTHPEISSEWHPTKNHNLTQDDVTIGMTQKVWWKCPKGDDHEWQAGLNLRGRGFGCPICSGRKVVTSNCLATIEPDLCEEWHQMKNGVLSPYDVTKGSPKKIWWQCPKGIDHVYQSTISDRRRGLGCPICSGRVVVQSNSLSTVRSDIAKQWHLEKNGKFTADMVTTGSPKKAWWKCPNGDDHVWKTSVNARTNGTGCPYCTLTPQSKQELTITFELSKFFNEINPKGLKTRIKGKLHSIDIFIPKINLGVEFDGSYWHKGKRELDKMKTLKFEAAGFNIVRIREEPLKRIFDTDIISKQPYNGKEITNDLLKFIMSTYKLDKRTITKFEEYLLKDELQNQKALENYIEQILTTKALENKKRTTTKPKLH